MRDCPCLQPQTAGWVQLAIQLSCDAPHVPPLPMQLKNLQAQSPSVQSTTLIPAHSRSLMPEVYIHILRDIC